MLIKTAKFRSKVTADSPTICIRVESKFHLYGDFSLIESCTWLGTCSEFGPVLGQLKRPLIWREDGY